MNSAVLKRFGSVTKSALALAAFLGSLGSYAAKVTVATRTADGGGVSWHASTKFLGGSSEMSAVIWTKDCSATWYLYLLQQEGQFSVSTGNGTQPVVFEVTQGEGSVSVTSDISILSKNILKDGGWHCVCVTFKHDATDSSGSFLRIYCDGVLAGETSGSIITGPLESPTQGLTVGGLWQSDGYANWKIAGSFAELSLWDRALTTSEVGALASRRPWCGEQGLVGYWLHADAETQEKSQRNGAKNGATANMGLSVSNYTLDYVEDASFPCGNEYYVESDEWAAAHPAYVPSGKSYRTREDPALVGQVQDILDSSPVPPVLVFGEGSYSPTAELTITRGDAVHMKRLDESKEVVFDGQGARRLLKIDPPAVNGSPAKDVNIEINGLTFINGNGSNGSGGAVYMGSGCGSSSALTADKRCRLVNCVFSNNVAAYDSNCNGGALYLARGYVSNCVFTANSAARNGGAICCAGAATYYNQEGTLTYEYNLPSVYDCTFKSNVACRGGAIADSNDGAGGWFTYVVRGGTFDGNTTGGTALATKRGGQIALAPGCVLADAFLTGTCDANYGSCVDWTKQGVSVSRCTFAGLTVNSGYGVVHAGSENSFVDRCVFSNNTLNVDVVFAEGGGTDILLRNCLFVKNTLPNVSSVVASHNATQIRMESCTLADNTKTLTNYPFRNNSGSAKYVSVNSICADRSTVINAGTLIVSNSCVVAPAPGGTSDSGVLVGVPRFVDAAHGNYALAGGTCRDKGLVLPWMDSASVDLAGLPRLVNGSGVAYAPDALPDLGCYEIQTARPGLMLLFR